MYLIIAEKPSLGRNIAAGLGNFQRKDGYLENEQYIITWAFGHLFSLVDIEYYKPTESNRWTMENLPCFPESFRFELRKGKDKQVDGGVVKQFKTIEYLCNRDDVDTIVNAGDADREGEIIVRTCIKNALRSQKAVKRLWLPDQTPETVRNAFSDMKDDSEYDNLANEGYARTYIDWLYGVNLTRYATLRSGVLLRVGRVIVPIVRAIYDRDMAIKNFKPEKYCDDIANNALRNSEWNYWKCISENEVNGCQRCCIQSLEERAVPVLRDKSCRKKRHKREPEDRYSGCQVLYFKKRYGDICLNCTEQ